MPNDFPVSNKMCTDLETWWIVIEAKNVAKELEKLFEDHKHLRYRF